MEINHGERSQAVLLTDAINILVRISENFLLKYRVACFWTFTAAEDAGKRRLIKG